MHLVSLSASDSAWAGTSRVRQGFDHFSRAHVTFAACVCTRIQALCKVETLKSIFFQKNYLEHLPAEIAGLTNVTGPFSPVCLFARDLPPNR